jgi:2-(3-amino-3-carboxypropyl)histidine synthase
MKILFIEAKADKDFTSVIAKSLKSIPEKRIGLISTVQFTNQLEKVKKTFEDNNKVVVIGKPSGSAVLDGQILGCDVSSATNVINEVDCFLYLGTGNFHPFGILAKPNLNEVQMGAAKQKVSLATDKPLYVLDPFTEKLRGITKEEKQKLWKKQVLRLEQFKACRTIGIIVSTKLGQCRLQAEPEELKEKLEKQGKKVYLFVCDNITNSELLNFPRIEGWVNTACPRLADDVFDKPFVNACELE